MSVMAESIHIFNWLYEQEETAIRHLPAAELEARLIEKYDLTRGQAVRTVRAYLDKEDGPPSAPGFPPMTSFCDRCAVFLEATKRMTPRRYRCGGCGALLCEHQATVSTGGGKWHKVYNRQQAVWKKKVGKKTKKRSRKVIKEEYLCGPCEELKEES